MLLITTDYFPLFKINLTCYMNCKHLFRFVVKLCGGAKLFKILVLLENLMKFRLCAT